MYVITIKLKEDKAHVQSFSIYSFRVVDIAHSKFKWEIFDSIQNDKINFAQHLFGIWNNTSLKDYDIGNNWWIHFYVFIRKLVVSKKEKKENWHLENVVAAYWVFISG